jgi:hypothetical protein
MARRDARDPAGPSRLVPILLVDPFVRHGLVRSQNRRRLSAVTIISRARCTRTLAFRR